MPSAKAIILEMEKLSPDEIRVILQHFEPEKEFSDAVIRQLLQAKKDAEAGINMSPELEGEEITNYLNRLKAQTP